MLQAFKPKIIFFDIDHTLIDTRNGAFLPESIPSVIRRLKDKGIIVAIATGRPQFAIPKHILDLNFDAFVTINGQVVRKNNVILRQKGIAPDLIESIGKWAKSNNITYGFETDLSVAVSRDDPKVVAALRSIHENPIIDPDFYKISVVNQVWAFENEKIEETFPKKLLDKLKVVRWHELGVDILPKEASKAKGIEVLLTELNLTPQEAMGFGDGANDIEMFQLLGCSVAMGQCNKDLLPFCDYQTKDLRDDGILYALEKFNIL